ncbi:hypothetical protein BGZ73_005385 [Actinomortierella ambigua]|nr:hypothetical protein BGZ73_005385 [Actinomortierella ambigua]
MSVSSRIGSLERFIHEFCGPSLEAFHLGKRRKSLRSVPVLDYKRTANPTYVYHGEVVHTATLISTRSPNLKSLMLVCAEPVTMNLLQTFSVSFPERAKLSSKDTSVIDVNRNTDVNKNYEKEESMAVISTGLCFLGRLAQLEQLVICTATYDYKQLERHRYLPKRASWMLCNPSAWDIANGRSNLALCRRAASLDQWSVDTEVMPELKAILWPEDAPGTPHHQIAMEGALWTRLKTVRSVTLVSIMEPYLLDIAETKVREHRLLRHVLPQVDARNVIEDNWMFTNRLDDIYSKPRRKISLK